MDKHEANRRRGRKARRRGLKDYKGSQGHLMAWLQRLGWEPVDTQAQESAGGGIGVDVYLPHDVTDVLWQNKRMEEPMLRKAARSGWEEIVRGASIHGGGAIPVLRYYQPQPPARNERGHFMDSGEDLCVLRTHDLMDLLVMALEPETEGGET